MRYTVLFSTLYLAAACSEATTGPLSESHAPIRSPCAATDIPLLTVARLRCTVEPPSPMSGDRDVWRGALPKTARLLDANGNLLSESTYDYGKAIEFPGAVYRSDGNLESITFDDYFGSAPSPRFEYQYAGITLVGAHAVWPDGRIEGKTEVVYEDGRRAYDGLVDQPGARWNYHYDADGQIVSRVGAGAAGKLPSMPEPSLLTQECNGLAVPTPDDPHALAGAIYYFRDDNGRITHTVQGLVPGFSFSKSTYEYNGDQLTSVTTECSESAEPSAGNRRVEYGY